MTARTFALLWTAHVGTVVFMTGLIWLIQIVHYPLMASVGEARFAAYHTSHSSLITPLVGPVMLAELVTAGALVLWPPPAELSAAPGAAVRIACLALTLATWAVTFFLSVPAHGRLGAGFDAAAHARLVATNWLRTAAWSGHAVVGLAATVRMIAPG